MIRGHIWSCDRAGDGIERLKYIRDRYYFAGVNSVREVYGKNDSWIDFENGDRFIKKFIPQHWTFCNMLE